jgi:hypothetical protein
MTKNTATKSLRYLAGYTDEELRNICCNIGYDEDIRTDAAQALRNRISSHN